MNDRASYVRVVDLSHRLGTGENQTYALKGVNLDFKEGELNAVVGPSGCGKSTLLYLIGLLDKPDRGQIHINGSNLANALDYERTEFRRNHIGFVFQFHFLIPEFTSIENIMLPMRRLNLYDGKEIEDRAHALLVDVGLANKAKRPANQLSGGEQQRVAIARAMANKPSLLLADEPTGNLDVDNSEKVFQNLEKISKENKTCIVLVTHNTQLAEKCERIWEMQDGEIVGP